MSLNTRQVRMKGHLKFYGLFLIVLEIHDGTARCGAMKITTGSS